MTDKDNAENHTEKALKNFQCSIFFGKKDFQVRMKLSILKHKTLLSKHR